MGVWSFGRNGTSLLTTIINNCIPSVLAFNELEHDRRAKHIEIFFRRIRNRIDNGDTICNRFDIDGDLATNPYRTFDLESCVYVIQDLLLITE